MSRDMMIRLLTRLREDVPDYDSHQNTCNGGEDGPCDCDSANPRELLDHVLAALSRDEARESPLAHAAVEKTAKAHGWDEEADTLAGWLHRVMTQQRSRDEAAPASLVALVREFIDYWTGRERHPDGGCGNCGGLPHSTTCFVGRFEQALRTPAAPSAAPPGWPDANNPVRWEVGNDVRRVLCGAESHGRRAPESASVSGRDAARADAAAVTRRGEVPPSSTWGDIGPSAAPEVETPGPGNPRQIEIDRATKPLHAEIETLRAERDKALSAVRLVGDQLQACNHQLVTARAERDAAPRRRRSRRYV